MSASSPPPLTAPPPLRASAPPGLPPATPPAHQKLTLYASGALVVLIVLVIILLGGNPRRAVLPYVPAGCRTVQVIDLARYLDGPVHAALVALKHSSAGGLNDAEEKLGALFGRDALLLAEADHMQILAGRLRPAALRAAFERTVKRAEDQLNQGRSQPIKLEVREDQPDGRPCYFCKQELLDLAFAPIGSSLACFADGAGVRSFLKTYAGVSKPVLSDEAFAAVYSAADARRAFLYRLEKPDGKILAQTLVNVVGQNQTDIRAAFFALTLAGKTIDATLRFLCSPEDLAKAREDQFKKDAGQKALADALGVTPVRVGRSGSLVTLEAAVPLDRFKEIAVQDKLGQTRNLLLSLLAR